jgi:predicted RNase H-like HicB family nuclease
MQNQFTAIIRQDSEWCIAYRLAIPRANGQGTSRDEAIESVRNAIALVLEDRTVVIVE